LLTGKVASWSEAAAAFEQAFSSVFEVSFINQGLTNLEFETAIALQRSKYNHSDWTERL
jgi:lipoate-protein ligase A